MDIKLAPSVLKGEIKAVASKSQAHRLLICAAFSNRPTLIKCGESSADIEATAKCITSLGAIIADLGGEFFVSPMICLPDERARLDCGESGSTLRFLMPVACALGAKAEFAMGGKLPKRPMAPLLEQLAAHGCEVGREDGLLRTSGQLRSGVFELPGNVSSQFVSGLLFALPMLEGDSEIRLTGALESLPYVQMTLDALERFGVEVVQTVGGAPNAPQTHIFRIRGSQKLRSPGKATVEGDWSNAAFWLCAGAIGGGKVACFGLDMTSKQGDREIVNLLERFGARTERLSDGVAVSGCNLTGIEIDASDTPDLVPILAVVASVARGQTRIFNAGRLRIKESDRLKTVAETLKALGADIEETSDGLIISGKPRLSGGVVSSHGDHRIAMAAAVASTVCEGEVVIRGAEATDKSYPAFFRDFAALGGRVGDVQ